MNYLQRKTTRFGERGMSPLGFLFIIILILILMFLFDQALIIGPQCKDEDFISCALDIVLGDDEAAPPQEGSVAATGVISGEFKGTEHSVTITLNIPLEGGNVTGNFSGDCDGSIKGSYAGGGGTISGTANGSCAYVFPASGKFSGTVNESGKTVPLRGSGRASGFEKEGSLTLTY